MMQLTDLWDQYPVSVSEERALSTQTLPHAHFIQRFAFRVICV